jgi:hypothetical protein
MDLHSEHLVVLEEPLIQRMERGSLDADTTASVHPVRDLIRHVPGMHEESGS